MTQIKRVVVWFSAGVTSAIAAKMAIEKYRGSLPVHLVYCDTGSEDEDNSRFAADVSRWLEISLEVIRNENFQDTFEVYDKSGFIKGPRGARCTVELKKKPRMKYQDLGGDLQVFGFDAGEAHRAKKFVRDNPEIKTWFPLVEAGISKTDCRQMLANEGIQEPRTYAEGFKNANCLNRGCPKGGIGYWNHLRQKRPEVFWAMAQKERELGYAILRKEVGREGKKRLMVPLYLDELDPGEGNYKEEKAFQCGLFCG
jgi:3'-phosphoadenosine 5'-phosphosulfate sulfotransferase (PAPS reductase)/FAD synthetase